MELAVGRHSALPSAIKTSVAVARTIAIVTASQGGISYSQLKCRYCSHRPVLWGALGGSEPSHLGHSVALPPQLTATTT